MWNSVELKAGFAGNMGSDGISDVVPGRGVGFETDEDPEVFSGWGRHRRLPLAMVDIRFVLWMDGGWWGRASRRGSGIGGEVVALAAILL